jgi:hydroxysqualene dehydroxylase
MRVLVIGAGWAGLAAAVEATRLGHQVAVCEASRTLGGRARALEVKLPSGQTATLDNGQHILIGAYSDALKLMGDVGVDTSAALLRLPLTLRYPDGGGLTLPDWRKPWFAGLDVAAGILQAKGWSLVDKLSLLRAADAWRRADFGCPAHYSVAQLCQGVSQRVMVDMIEPLVVSALNTPADRASAVVFLRVMRDALFAASSAEGKVAGSNMLLPRQDLSQLFPQLAAQWLAQHGAVVQQGERVSDLSLLLKTEQTIEYPRRKSAYIFSNYDFIIMATPAPEAARLVRSLRSAEGAGSDAEADGCETWARSAEVLQHEALQCMPTAARRLSPIYFQAP